MSREEAIAALRGYLPTIRRDFGVRRIALFGSTARGDAREDSDLDILVDFEKDPTFLSFMGLKAFLEDHLGRANGSVVKDLLRQGQDSGRQLTACGLLMEASLPGRCWGTGEAGPSSAWDPDCGVGPAIEAQAQERLHQLRWPGRGRQPPFDHG